VKHSRSVVTEIIWIKGKMALGADASRKIVHVRHTLVKFLKPFSRSFGAVSLNKHVRQGSLFADAQPPLPVARRSTGWAKAAAGWQREVGDSLGRGRWVMHQRYGKARSGGVLIIGARL